MATDLTVSTTVNPIDPDLLNTYEQTCDNVAQLQGFIGIPDMQVYMRGYVSPNDGGQGPFYWNATGTAPDDGGVTTIVPSGSVAGSGEWTRILTPAPSGPQNFTNAVNFADAGNIASASTTLVGSAPGNYATITGNVTINGFDTAPDGAWRRVRFTGTPTLTYNAMSFILPSAANIVVAIGDTADFVSLGSGNWVLTDYQRFSGQALITPSSSASIKTVNAQTFTGSGTYTPTAGMSYCIVEMIAGGGGGGSIAAATTAGAGGGGSGGYLKALLIAAQIGTSKAITISGGGIGGVVGGNNTGSAGGNVSLGSLLACTGGLGGVGAGAQVSGGSGGAATVTTGTSMVAITGGTGGVGGFSTIAIGGQGADSLLGQGGGSGFATGLGTIPGLSGNGYGSGGAGACSANSSTTQAGGNGAPGVIVITEFISS